MMEGFIVNNSGSAKHVFQRKFPSRHKMYLADIWPSYEDRVKADIHKKKVSEEEFVGWLEAKGKMLSGFEYVSGEKAAVAGEIAAATPAIYDEQGISADGRLEYPSLAGATQNVINKLTYNDVASLRVVDKPKIIIGKITNKSKLRRAFTIVRQAGRKQFLEKVLRERLQVLERP